MGDDLLGHFKVKTAVNCNLAPYRFIIDAFYTYSGLQN